MALRDALLVWDKSINFMTGDELTAKMAALPNSAWTKLFSGESQTGEPHLQRKVAIMAKAKQHPKTPADESMNDVLRRVEWIAEQPFYDTGIISKDDAKAIVAALKAHYQF